MLSRPVLSRTFVISAGCAMLAASGALAQSPPLQAPPVQPPAASATDQRLPDWGQRAPRGNDRGMSDRTAGGINACRADMQDLCGRAGGGRGGRLQCLIENRDRVQPACAEMLAAIEGREPSGRRRAERGRDGFDGRGDGGRGDRQGDRRTERWEDRRGDRGDDRQGSARVRPGQACRADAQALCGAVERGPARRQCLIEHEAQLSAPCREALANGASRRSEARPDVGRGFAPDERAPAEPR